MLSIDFILVFVQILGGFGEICRKYQEEISRRFPAELPAVSAQRDRAKVTQRTSTAPASSSFSAEARRDAPVVTTSSTSKIRC